MSALSVLTIVRNRTEHLLQLVEGLKRSGRAPDELVIVDMSDEPICDIAAPFPVHIDRFEVDGLPLAAARNRAAAKARSDLFVFLDVDCIPMSSCLARLDDEAAHHDGLLCAEVRYLGPGDLSSAWTETSLLAKGMSHPARAFPADGVRFEENPGLFWSLGFAIRSETFAELGGFDERFDGYGAEDTDFGFRAAAAGLPLIFVGGALACHQYHDSYDPPVNHLADIVANARRFYARWERWPMEGWLAGFADMGLVQWQGSRLDMLREATSAERSDARVAWPAGLTFAKPDRSACLSIEGK